MDRKILLLCILVLISRLPFIFDGFGHEEDSWGLALNTLNMKATGAYEASRLPGHPVQEIIYALIPLEYWTLNLLSAFMSCVAVYFFAASLKKLNIQHYLLAGLCFSMVPVIYAASTYTIDYMWATAFCLAAFYFFLNKKYWITGILLGLAIGCRITSGAWLLCFLPFFDGKLFSKASIKPMLQLLLPLLLTTFLCYIPVINKYGTGFFLYYDQFPYPPLSKVIYKASIGVWGLLGVVALVVLFPLTLKGGRSMDKQIVFSLIIAIVLFSISYLRLPQKSGYMIPIIPFVLLFFYHRLNVKAMYMFSFLLLMSPFVMGINLTDGKRGADHSELAIKFSASGQEIFLDPISGPILNERSKRIKKGEFSTLLLSSLAHYPDSIPPVIIAGWWYNELKFKKEIDNQLKTDFRFYLSEGEMKQLTADGHRLFYLPEQDLYNDLYSGITSTNQYAQPYPGK